MQQPDPRQVLGRSQGVRSFQQRRGTDRHLFMVKQSGNKKSRPIATTIANGHIDALALEIDQPRGRTDADAILREIALEKMQARHQPANREPRRGTDRQDLFLVRTRPDGVRRLRHLFKGAPDDRGIFSAFIGQLDAAGQSFKQAAAQELLDLPDLAAHRTMGNEQIARRRGEALVARGGFEGAQRVQWWKSFHSCD